MLKGLDSAIADIEGLKFNVNDKLKGMMFQALGNIQSGTPRDTGRAANNWFVSTSSPSTKFTARVNGNRITLDKLPEIVIGKRIFYTNNLPYIYGLEYEGRSDQATNGWVRAEIIRLKAGIRKI